MSVTPVLTELIKKIQEYKHDVKSYITNQRKSAAIYHNIRLTQGRQKKQGTKKMKYLKAREDFKCR